MWPKRLSKLQSGNATKSDFNFVPLQSQQHRKTTGCVFIIVYDKQSVTGRCGTRPRTSFDWRDVRVPMDPRKPNDKFASSPHAVTFGFDRSVVHFHEILDQGETN